ncbi:MAG TPA: hypothetical protein VGP88_03835 [Thermoplasmata archaeon]|jgi:hypothetical protein|nr:hypothetical protein [Thermoplasmata archaeon]
MSAETARSARSLPLWLAILIPVVALVILLPMAFGAGLALHSTCALTPIGTESIWTPGVVVNSPPNGSALGWANGSTVGGDSTSPVLRNGSAGVVEVEMNWTVYRTGMTWVAGPGLRDQCTRPYWATATATKGFGAIDWCVLQGPDSVSDVGLSPDAPVAGCPFLGTDQAAAFNDSFTLACGNRSAYAGGCGARTVDEAGSVHASFRTSVTGFPVEIPIPGQTTGPWLGVADPMNQTAIASISGLGCWAYEPTGVPAGLSTGLLTWGPYGTLTSVGPNPVCTFG